MKTVVFAGPTLFDRDSFGFHRCPPARLGSVFWAWTEGIERVVIIDGYFGTMPSIWHKEILFAIKTGIEVWGAGSMGALRAAELWQLGMGGYGSVFRWYRAGVINDDDEICVTHTIQKNYRPLTESLVNVRATLRRCRRSGVIDSETERELVQRIKGLHFSERSLANLAVEFVRVLGHCEGSKLLDQYRQRFFDQKGTDAEGLLRGLRDGVLRLPYHASRGFPMTLHWRRQFIEQFHDLPPGDVDPYVDGLL